MVEGRMAFEEAQPFNRKGKKMKQCNTDCEKKCAHTGRCFFGSNAKCGYAKTSNTTRFCNWENGKCEHGCYAYPFWVCANWKEC